MIKLFIATHKAFDAPKNPLYVPVHVGAEGKEALGYEKDNTGENISLLNPYFCELTALYWAWKNDNSEYIGLVHYRRYLSHKKQRYTPEVVLDDVVLKEEDILSDLQNGKLIVPSKRHYYISTLYHHYASTFDKSHLDHSRDIISELCPEYLDSYDSVMQQTFGYMFNMFIGQKQLVDRYCEWLFPILFELQNRVDLTQMSAFEKRLFGRVSEILFNVWLHKNAVEVVEKPLYDAFSVNWFKKGGAFLMAKFFGKKYTKSF